MDGRGVQDHTVVIDDGQAVGVDVEAEVTAEGGFNESQGVAGAEELPEDLLTSVSGVGWGLVVFPAQPSGLALQLRREVPVLAMWPVGSFRISRYSMDAAPFWWCLARGEISIAAWISGYHKRAPGANQPA